MRIAVYEYSKLVGFCDPVCGRIKQELQDPKDFSQRMINGKPEKKFPSSVAESFTPTPPQRDLLI